MQIASQRPSGIRNRRTRAVLTGAYLLAPLLAILVLGAAWSVRSQSTQRTIPAPPRIELPTGFGVPMSNDAVDPVTAERRREALRLQHHKQIVADSEKLLKLTQQLNEEVAAAGPGPLTQEQLDKLGKIEKLARSVKSEMIDNPDQPSQSPSVAGPPVYSRPNFSPK